jgi:hypothetical protein
MKNKTMAWEQKAISIGGENYPGLEFLLTVVHKENQPSFIKDNKLTLTKEELELASRGDTDFITLHSKDGKVIKYAVISTPDSKGCKTLYYKADKDDAQLSRAVSSLIVNLYT